MPVEIPPNLGWLRNRPDGRAWLGTLPAVIAACAEDWDLKIGDVFEDSYVSLVVATDRDRVLKVQWPNRESDTEADALRAWNGNGAIRLLDHDPTRHALLLERCFPGDHLSSAGPQIGLDVLLDLLPRLWVSVGEPFATLSAETRRWVSNLPNEFAAAGEPFERSLLDRAIETLTDLAASQGEQVLLHQDLHGNNVLSAAREPWLVIDPKPLVGEREFGLSPIIRSDEFGSGRKEVLYRLDRLTDELGLDRERARLWAFGQAVAWGFEGDEVLPRSVEMARCLLDS